MRGFKPNPRIIRGHILFVSPDTLLNNNYHEGKFYDRKKFLEKHKNKLRL